MKSFERDIADRFWFFVRGRAIDGRVRPRYGTRFGSKTLDHIDSEYAHLQEELVGQSREDDMTCFWEEDWQPWTYPTLQEAMTAFLINSAATNEFPYPCDMWLRAVAVILADAARDPEWLHVVACDWDPNFGDGPEKGERRTEPYSEEDHAMTISDDWSCLSRETFEFIMATYTGKG
ncbi:hypothetical protein [Catenulispora rubra]|uniref:hypothetical protein n=1 Tax=Catenulispora rubra TaxID=280293 RepID=UPI001891FEBF|nr:hypothetical protein [Catenulispora rubra]